MTLVHAAAAKNTRTVTVPAKPDKTSHSPGNGFFISISQHGALWAGILIIVIGALWSIHLPFFWDTILYSRIADWMGENQYSIILPENLDTGNPSWFQLLLAYSWKFFGKSLATGHLLILPISLGLYLLFYFIASEKLEGRWLWLCCFLFLLDPTLIAQSAQVSQEILVCFLFFLGIRSLEKNNNLLLMLACLGLSFTHLRGILLIPAIGLSILIKNEGRRMVYLIPSVCMVLFWLILHRIYTGWWIGSPAEWHEHRRMLPASGIFKNIGIIIWRFADFGRIFISLCALISIYIFIKLKDKSYLHTLLITGFILYTITFIIFSNPIGHRYFLPFFLGNILLSFRFLHKKNAFRWAIFLVGVQILLSGIFLCKPYPPPLANGWDSFPGYFFYFKPKKEMDRYIRENHIPAERTAAGFPLLASTRYSELAPLGTGYKNKYFGGIELYPYVIYSNVNNDFTPLELEKLRRWVLVKEFRNGPVFIRLYKNPFQY